MYRTACSQGKITAGTLMLVSCLSRRDADRTGANTMIVEKSPLH